MLKSEQTIQLEHELTALDAKIKALQEVSEILSNCPTKVKSTYNGAYSDHVEGRQYDRMYEEENDVIDGFSTKLKSKKSKIMSEIESNLSRLKNLQTSVHLQLSASRRADEAATTAQQARTKD
ncbi:hypothetical protein [Streptococcus sp. DD13]|uniref:hypothetical protein n=1 Tax=Streptococcus sp. DD13 TaxID=1777881 RepID=UPI0007935497|nr:hypothetical protein [Streptococcus sp. DD13]KXT77717.1 hypothetical protein STRDD13_01397 [Streptococcus sp. DD13]